MSGIPMTYDSGLYETGREARRRDLPYDESKPREWLDGWQDENGDIQIIQSVRISMRPAFVMSVRDENIRKDGTNG